MWPARQRQAMAVRRSVPRRDQMCMAQRPARARPRSAHYPRALAPPTAPENAGTIEHLHDVTKSDLATRLPPSGKLGANAAWYRLNLLTYNVLSVLKRYALPERLRHARPKRLRHARPKYLRFELFTVPAVLRQHARKLTAPHTV